MAWRDWTLLSVALYGALAWLGFIAAYDPVAPLTQWLPRNPMKLLTEWQ